jgi:hypothetical protein
VTLWSCRSSACVLFLLVITVSAATQAGAQQKNPLPAIPRDPHGIKGLTIPDEPEHPEPAATSFHDSRYHVAFQVPAGWNFERRDGVLTTFRTEVRSAKQPIEVRGVAAINFNPYPPTTFAGATFYYSVAPHSDVMSCAAQATTGHMKPKNDLQVAGLPFKHGQDEHGAVCTESRDEVFTALRGKSCLRFDLVVNTFCSQTSGAMEITPAQLGDVNARLANMLGSVRIDR